MSKTIRYFVPAERLPELVGHVYDLSKAQGLGRHHATPDPLTESEKDHIAGVEYRGSPWVRMALDYIRGRACKFDLFVDTEQYGYGTGRLFFTGPCWYDHTPEQLLELVERMGGLESDNLPVPRPRDEPATVAAGDDAPQGDDGRYERGCV